MIDQRGPDLEISLLLLQVPAPRPTIFDGIGNSAPQITAQELLLANHPCNDPKAATLTAVSGCTAPSFNRRDDLLTVAHCSVHLAQTALIGSDTKRSRRNHEEIFATAQGEQRFWPTTVVEQDNIVAARDGAQSHQAWPTSLTGR